MQSCAALELDPALSLTFCPCGSRTCQDFTQRGSGRCNPVKNRSDPLSLAGAATSIIFVTTELCLSRQAYFCRDKNYTSRSSRQ